MRQYSSILFRFAVHRLIMTSSSNYFESMLGPNFKEGRDDEVTIADIDGPTLESIINYCYTGHIEITEENVMQIVYSASTMGFVRIEQECKMYLSNNLKAVNCVEIFVLADKLQFLQLRKKSLAYICVMFRFVPEDQLRCLQYSYFSDLLLCDTIQATEDSIFERLVMWIKHSEQSRAKYVPDLLKLVRMENISTQVRYDGGNLKCIKDVIQFLNLFALTALTWRR